MNSGPKAFKSATFNQNNGTIIDQIKIIPVPLLMNHVKRYSQLLLILFASIFGVKSYAFDTPFPAWLPDEYITEYGTIPTVRDIETTPDNFVIAGYMNYIFQGYSATTLLNLNTGYPSDSIINYKSFVDTAFTDGNDGWLVDYVTTPDDTFYTLAHIYKDGTLNEKFISSFENQSAYMLGQSKDKQALYVVIKDNEKGSFPIKEFAKYDLSSDQLITLNFDVQSLNKTESAPFDLIELTQNEVIFLSYEKANNQFYIFYMDFSVGDSSLRKFPIDFISEAENNYFESDKVSRKNRHSLQYSEVRNEIRLVFIDQNDYKKIRNYTFDLNSFQLKKKEHFLENNIKTITSLNRDGTRYLLQFDVDNIATFKIINTIDSSLVDWYPPTELSKIVSLTTSKDYKSIFLAGTKKDFVEQICDDNNSCTNIYAYNAALFKIDINSSELLGSAVSRNNNVAGPFYPRQIFLSDTESEVLLSGYTPSITARTVNYIYALNAQTLNLVKWFPALPGPALDIEYNKQDKTIGIIGKDYTAKVSLESETILCLNDCDPAIELKQPYPEVNPAPYQDILRNPVHLEYKSETLPKIVAITHNNLSVVDTSDGYSLIRELEYEGYPLINSHFSLDGKIFHFAFNSGNSLNFIDYNLENDTIINEIINVPAKRLGSDTAYRTSELSSYRLLNTRELVGQHANKLQFLPYQFPQTVVEMSDSNITIKKEYDSWSHEWTYYLSDYGYLYLNCLPDSFLDCARIQYVKTLFGSSSLGDVEEYTDPIYIENNQLIDYWAVNAQSSEPKSSLRLIIDKTPPVTRLNKPGGKYEVDSMSLNFLCQDDYEYGCEFTYFTVDGSIPEVKGEYYNYDLANIKNGTYKLRSFKYPKDSLKIYKDTTILFFSVDQAGRQEDVKTISFILTEKPWWKGSVNYYALLIFGVIIFVFRCSNRVICRHLKAFK